MWFSLIEKVSTERTLQLVWENVLSNAGPAAWTASRWIAPPKSPKPVFSLGNNGCGTYIDSKLFKRVWIAKPEVRPSSGRKPIGTKSGSGPGWGFVPIEDVLEKSVHSRSRAMVSGATRQW